MKIDLMRAFAPDCMDVKTCWMCESRFVPKAVVIFSGPHGEEMCEVCFRACCERTSMSNVPAQWPTWKEYFDLCEEYSEPIFGSSEEMEQAENLGLFDEFEQLAYLTREGVQTDIWSDR